jgi:tetratricopeptide (TPR) repeat protein
MRHVAFLLPTLVLCLTLPARADKRLDDAVAKAEAQLAKGKPDEAVKILRKAADKARRDPEPQLALARLLTRLGRLEEAGTALARADELAAAAPPAVRARVLAERSTLVLRTGTLGQATELAREAVGLAAGPESLAALARAQARAGDPAARESAERAVRAAPGSAAAQLAHADALRSAWLGAEAEAAYRRVLELAPRSPSAQAGLALALAMQGKDSAIDAARVATEADPGSSEAQIALGMAVLALDPQDHASLAIAAVQQASALEPKSAPAKLAVGRVFESRNQLPQAAAAFEEAASLDPGWGAPQIGGLRVRLRQGDAPGALAGLRALPDEHRISGEAALLLGELLRLIEDPIDAEAAFARAAAAMPGRAEAHVLHGTAAYDAGDLTLAADALGRAVALDPANLDDRLKHARYLAYDGRLDESVAVLLALGGQPEGMTPALLIELGGVYRSFKPPRVEEAVGAYKRALVLDPRSGEAALGVARSYRAGRQWERAVDAYERVSGVNPRLEGEAMLGAAWCFLASGDDYKARFYTGLAARAGADVERLRSALTGPAGGGAAELAELEEGLAAKHAGVQVRAVRGLLGLGRPPVPLLARALGRKGTSLAAREAIVEGLATMGPAAREALPQLDRLIKAGPPKAAAEPAAASERQRREARLIAAMDSAAARIRGE